LASKWFWPTSGCINVQFWYHSHGSSDGTNLTLLQEGYDDALWAVDTSNQNKWSKVSEIIIVSHPTRVSIIVHDKENNYASTFLMSVYSASDTC